jgi:hypothetical protein
MVRAYLMAVPISIIFWIHSPFDPALTKFFYWWCAPIQRLFPSVSFSGFITLLTQFGPSFFTDGARLPHGCSNQYHFLNSWPFRLSSDQVFYWWCAPTQRLFPSVSFSGFITLLIQFWFEIGSKLFQAFRGLPLMTLLTSWFFWQLPFVSEECLLRPSFSWTPPNDLTDVPAFFTTASLLWRVPAETKLFVDSP